MVGCGAEDMPCKSIQHAVNISSEYDTILLMQEDNQNLRVVIKSHRLWKPINLCF